MAVSIPLGRRERDLLKDMGRRGLRRHKRQLQMIDFVTSIGEQRSETNRLLLPVVGNEGEE